MSKISLARQWSDHSLLKSIPTPAREVRQRISIKSPEVTFLGAANQPDFARVTIAYVPAERVIELRSLKFYFTDFRSRLLSYERFLAVVFEDLMTVYRPQHLRVTVRCNPRGGLSSLLVADSDEQEVLRSECPARWPRKQGLYSRGKPIVFWNKLHDVAIEWRDKPIVLQCLDNQGDVTVLCCLFEQFDGAELVVGVTDETDEHDSDSLFCSKDQFVSAQLLTSGLSHAVESTLLMT